MAGISIVSSDIEQWKARSMEDATNKAINQDKGGPNIENERDAHLQSGFANAEVKRDIEVMIEKSSKQGRMNFTYYFMLSFHSLFIETSIKIID